MTASASCRHSHSLRAADTLGTHPLCWEHHSLGPISQMRGLFSHTTSVQSGIHTQDSRPHICGCQGRWEARGVVSSYMVSLCLAVPSPAPGPLALWSVSQHSKSMTGCPSGPYRPQCSQSGHCGRASPSPACVPLHWLGPCPGVYPLLPSAHQNLALPQATPALIFPWVTALSPLQKSFFMPSLADADLC